MSLEEDAKQVLEEIEKRNLVGEVYALETEVLKMKMIRNKIVSKSFGTDKGFGIRIIKNEKVGFAFSKAKEVSRALEIAQKNLRKQKIELPEENFKTRDNLDREILELSGQDFLFILEEMGEGARNPIEIGLKKVFEKRIIANSSGLFLCDHTTYLEAYVQAEFKGRTSFEYDSSSSLKTDFFSLGERAFEHAKALKGQNRPKGEIILSPRVVSDLLSYFLLHSCSSQNLWLKRSRFEGKIGEKVASDAVSIKEVPWIESSPSSCDFDDEGVKTWEKWLIKDGFFVDFLYDLKNSVRYGKKAGNGFRSSYYDEPSVGVSNIEMLPGEASLEEIEGTVIIDLIGLHTCEPIAGDISLKADFLLMKEGEIVGGGQFQFVSNFFELLERMEPLKERERRGNYLVPYVKI